ncbi:MAG TPA: shikimate kinase [Cellvibrio sp.]|nr:shikimate kinase [Cellvibrio sp.]
MTRQESDVNVFSTNLILIGMPGAGKSTIGLLLAKELAKNFIDTDILIQLREGKTLQDILHEHGYQRLRDIEEEILLSVKCSNHIIATGGSAVYSEAGMKHLNSFGPVIFLDVPLEVLQQRIHNYETRGIARRPGQSFHELFEERRALYQKFANITIDCTEKSQEQVLQEIIYQEAETFAEMDA